MVRKLTLLLVFTALLIPGGVFALGLGEIHLKSALNQPFDASIDLLSVKPDELDGVKVTLATPEAFERVGADRLFILTKLRYEPDLDEEGRPVIRVTTRQTIREPFLNFLIEVNWAKGRLVREYTVLLDPPVTLERKPAPIKAPVAEPSPTAVQHSLPAPQSTHQASPSPPQVHPVGDAVAPSASADEYGPVVANESLWKIANKTKPQGVAVEQMMMALQRKNPQAFVRQNVNNLKRGAILRMPTQEEIDFLSVLEARAKFGNQVAEWKAVQPTAPVGDSGGDEPVAATSTTQPVAVSKLKLASVRPEGEGKGGVSEGDGTEEITSRLENELILAREQFESAKQERSELNSQVSQLESQLADLESLLAVRNEQLARLQNELKQSEIDVAPEIHGAAETEIEAEAEVELITEGESEEELEIIDVADEASDAEEIEITDETAETSQESPSAPQEMPQPTPAPEAIEQPAPTESTLDVLKGLFANNMIVAAAGGLVILLLLLLLARRRGANSDEFEESILIGSQGEDTESLGGSTDDTEVGISEAAETSFLSEFSHSDMDVLQDDTGEVDPVAEADVYIAYGRYQQAEELLRQAIERDPSQIKNHLKLLEILFVTKNAAAFTETAEALAPKSGGEIDAADWQQVTAMGHQLNPGHELFAGAEGADVLDEQIEPTIATAPEAEAETGADEENEDLDLMDLSELTADFDMDDEALDQGEGSISSLLEDDGLDFDLNLGLDSEKDKSDPDNLLLNADIADIGTDVELDDALEMSIPTELPDSSISTLDAETEASELSESISLDELGLDNSFEVDMLDEDDSKPTDGAEELLGRSEDLAAELSSFTDEPTGKEPSDDLTAEFPSMGDDLQGNQTSAQELEQALSGLTEDLSLDDTLDPEAELGGLMADEEGGLDLGGELNEPLSIDNLTEGTFELDELVLDGLELGESNVTESETLDPLASDEGLIIEDEPLSELSELAEEPDETDKTNTKLDLARAYVEMGDEEGARSILDEVLNEGDEAQKEDAQALLGRLS